MAIAGGLKPVEVELEAVGRNLAELRASRALSLRDLAELTGYTGSYLSQIERGESVPSLSALATVAAALGVEMTTLFEVAAGPRVHIARADAPLELRTAKTADQPAHSYAVVGAHGNERSYTALTHRLPAGEDPLEFRHFGERFCFVLAGAVEMVIGGDRRRLDEGEWVHYASHEAHTFGAIGDVEAVVLWIVSPAIF